MPFHRLSRLSRRAHLASLVACGLLAGACASSPAAPLPVPAAAVRNDDAALPQLLAYQQRLQAMSAPELARERGILAATAPGPLTQFRLALVLAQLHGAGDLARAQSLLENLLRTNTPAAQSLHAAARVFAAQYQERSRLELQNERLGQQLKDAQRQGDALQEKLDAIADIERSLPQRPTLPAPPQ